MTRPLLSAEWYRLRGLKPRLRGHVRTHRHVYRGRVWWVIEDRLGGTHHRFNAATHRVLELMDGRRDMDTLWALLLEDLSDETPTQDEIIHLLGQLHAADLVLADVTPDSAELFERHTAHERRRWLGRLGNPLALRFPLFDPDRLLQRILRRAGPLVGMPALLLWLAVIVPALVLVPSHWAELGSNAMERLLSADSQ